MSSEKPVKTEGDTITTNTAGILIFGRDLDGNMLSIPIETVSNSVLLTALEDILIELKKQTAQLILITNEPNPI